MAGMFSGHPVLDKFIVDKQLSSLTPIQNVDYISLAPWALHDKSPLSNMASASYQCTTNLSHLAHVKSTQISYRKTWLPFIGVGLSSQVGDPCFCIPLEVLPQSFEQR